MVRQVHDRRRLVARRVERRRARRHPSRIEPGRQQRDQPEPQAAASPPATTHMTGPEVAPSLEQTRPVGQPQPARPRRSSRPSVRPRRARSSPSGGTARRRPSAAPTTTPDPMVAGRVGARYLFRLVTRASGGIGRRAGFRCQCPLGRGGSSPPSPTTPPPTTLGGCPTSGPAPPSASSPSWVATLPNRGGAGPSSGSSRPAASCCGPRHGPCWGPPSPSEAGATGWRWSSHPAGLAQKWRSMDAAVSGFRPGCEAWRMPPAACWSGSVTIRSMSWWRPRDRRRGRHQLPPAPARQHWVLLPGEHRGSPARPVRPGHRRPPHSQPIGSPR